MSKADLSDASLTGANLQMSTLTGTRLIGARLVGTDLSGADLTGVVLLEVEGRGSKTYTDADLYAMNVADLLKTIGVSQVALLHALGVEEDRKMLRDMPAWSVPDLVDWSNMSLGNLLKSLGVKVTEADMSGVQYDETTRWPHGFKPQ
ncbi:MAG: pentapeptide repeat-containing protein [Chloroflexaceae bacterium]|nr:pentapeptide repeat-containing protein [Chloroflexaceae bacterium]